MAAAAALSLPIKNTFVHFHAAADGSPVAELDGSPVRIRSRRARSEGRGRQAPVVEPMPSSRRIRAWADLDSDDEEGVCCARFDSESTAVDSAPEWSSESGSDSEPLSSFAALRRPEPAQQVAVPVAAVMPMVPLPAPKAGSLASAVWRVPEQEVNSTRNKVCSGHFLVPVPGYGPCPFEIILYAEDRMSRVHGETLGFQRSQGRGRMEVRCQAKLPPGVGSLLVDVSVGTGSPQEQTKPPTTHDFSKQACLGWRHVDFRAAVDQASCSMMACANFAAPQ